MMCPALHTATYKENVKTHKCDIEFYKIGEFLALIAVSLSIPNGFSIVCHGHWYNTFMWSVYCGIMQREKNRNKSIICGVIH
jgi:hypothetical protein